MKATELIKALQEEVNAKGDKEIVIAANRHSYRNVKLVTKDDTTTLALFDKVQDSFNPYYVFYLKKNQPDADDCSVRFFVLLLRKA